MNKVSITEYDPVWISQYNTESKRIQSAMGEVLVSIHHVGSTAVPGLAAKPKIDIIVEIKDLSFEHARLLDLGYEYRGGYNLPLRKSFTYRSEGLDINLHVFEKDDPEVELNLLFRDYLRAHNDIRDEYAKLKYQLVEKEESHVKNGMMYRGYTLGKYEFIQDIVKAIGFNKSRFVLCAHYKEWEKANDFRKNLGLKNAEDTEKDRHLLLYTGVDIVGYAHVQIEKKAELLAIDAIDEERKDTLGRLIETWIGLIDNAVL